MNIRKAKKEIKKELSKWDEDYKTRFNYMDRKFEFTTFGTKNKYIYVKSLSGDKLQWKTMIIYKLSRNKIETLNESEELDIWMKFYEYKYKNMPYHKVCKTLQRVKSDIIKEEANPREIKDMYELTKDELDNHVNIDVDPRIGEW